MWVEGGGWWWPDGLERERRPLADTGLVLISPWQSGPRLQSGSSQAPVRLQSGHTREMEKITTLQSIISVLLVSPSQKLIFVFVS